jgi:hypothetical protein
VNGVPRLEPVVIENIDTDFWESGGVTLMKLLESCGDMEKLPIPKYKQEPKMRIHKLENLKKAFDYIRDKLNIKLVNVGGEDVEKGDPKITLALLWTLINHFSMGSIELDGISGKEGLLLWCQRQTKAYDNVKITNFAGSWKNGLAFCALLHRFGPEHIPFETLTADNPADNLALAFKVAKDVWGIEDIIDVEDITDAVRPDEKIIMTYLAMWFKCFAKFLKDEAVVNAIKGAIDTRIQHDGWVAAYAAGAAEQQAWMQGHVAKYSNTAEGKDGHGDTTETIKGSMDAFYEAQRTEMPEAKARLADLQVSLSTLLASQRKNGRDLFAPAEGNTPEALDQQWAALEGVMASYEVSLRASYVHFKQLDTVLAKLGLDCTKASSWLREQSALYEAADYGANSPMENQAAVAAFELGERQLAVLEDALPALQAATVDSGMGLHASAPQAMAQVGEVESELQRTRELGCMFKLGLQATAQELSKLLILVVPDTWLDQQQVRFDKADYGATSVEVQYLIDVHERQYLVQLMEQQQVLSQIARMRLLDGKVRRMSGEGGADAQNDLCKQAQAVVADRVKQLQDKFTRVEAAGQAHHDALKARHHDLAELVHKLSEYNSQATEFEFHVASLEEELVAPLTADSLAEAEALILRFDDEIKPAMEEVDSLMEDVNEIAAVLRESKEDEASAAFARYQPEALQDKHAQCHAALADYETKLRGADGAGGFLAAEKAKEAARLAFAAGAAAFLAETARLQAAADKELAEGGSATEEALAAQLAAIRALEEELRAAQAKMDAELGPVVQQLTECGVEDNPHTAETPYSLKLGASVLSRVLASNAERLEETLRLQEQFRAWAKEYDEAAAAASAKLGETLQKFQGGGEGGEGEDTAGAVKQLIDEFQTYTKEDKPQIKESIAKCQELLATLHAAQKKVNVPLYVATEGLRVEELQTLDHSCGEAEAGHEARLRAAYARFREFESAHAKFVAKAAKTSQWLAAQRDAFGAGEHGGSSVVACDALINSFALYEQQADQYRSQHEPFVALMGGEGMAKHTEHGPATARLAEIAEETAATDRAGALYRQLLDLCQGEHKKLRALLDPEAWMAGQETMFDAAAAEAAAAAAALAAGEAPKQQHTTSELTYLIDEHGRAFNGQVPAQREHIQHVLDEPGAAAQTAEITAAAVARGELGQEAAQATAPPDANVEARGAALLARLTAVTGKGAAHEAMLKKQRARLLKLALASQEFNALGAGFELDLDAFEGELASPFMLGADSPQEVEAITKRLEEHVRPVMFEQAVMGKLRRARALVHPPPEGGGEGGEGGEGGGDTPDTPRSAELGEEGEGGSLEGVLAVKEEADAVGAFARYNLAGLEEKLLGAQKLLGEFADRLSGPGGLAEQQREVDALRRRFAELADGDGTGFKPYSGGVTKEADGVMTAAAAGGDAAAKQLDVLQALVDGYKGEAPRRIAELEGVAEELAKREVFNNPYTSETIYSVRALDEAVAKGLTQRFDALEKQVLDESSLGLTPEQLQEIKDVFRKVLLGCVANTAVCSRDAHACAHAQQCASRHPSTSMPRDPPSHPCSLPCPPLSVRQGRLGQAGQEGVPPVHHRHRAGAHGRGGGQAPRGDRHLGRRPDQLLRVLCLHGPAALRRQQHLQAGRAARVPDAVAVGAVGQEGGGRGGAARGHDAGADQRRGRRTGGRQEGGGEAVRGGRAGGHRRRLPAALVRRPKIHHGVHVPQDEGGRGGLRVRRLPGRPLPGVTGGDRGTGPAAGCRLPRCAKRRHGGVRHGHGQGHRPRYRSRGEL